MDQRTRAFSTLKGQVERELLLTGGKNKDALYRNIRKYLAVMMKSKTKGLKFYDSKKGIVLGRDIGAKFSRGCKLDQTDKVPQFLGSRITFRITLDLENKSCL